MKKNLFFILVMVPIVFIALKSFSPKDDSTGSSSSGGGRTETHATHWVYDESVDKIRDETTYSAKIDSPDIINLEIPLEGGSVSSLVLKRTSKDPRTKIYLNVTPGQFPASLCLEGFESQDEHVTVKFDNKPAIDVPYCSDGTTSATQAILKDDDGSILNSIMESHTMYAAIDMFQQKEHQVSFDISGLKWANTANGGNAGAGSVLERLIDIETGRKADVQKSIDSDQLNSSNNYFHGFRVKSYSTDWNDDGTMKWGEIVISRDGNPLDKILRDMGSYCQVAPNGWTRTRDSYSEDIHIGKANGRKCNVMYETRDSNDWDIFYYKP
ncbi:hypothetical protein CFR73_03990 [Novacetimonas maltaceti]|uniref:Uncharacterized protein n=1 Tax=Novacetimonas maltaceti TaxID=1203393 RepID=A0A2S3W4F4_9PROT|nr:hypothetical protein [Novacetimonas maltaceti]POF63707.1 hypothetical protein KMAL_06750 [Novacetimonas maltaceti]PYD61236.1 hypothetical protein CFR73_03990 [Novacetimonas maltaceti]